MCEEDLTRLSGSTYGLETTNAKRNDVLNQFIVVSGTLKYSADVLDTAANVNH